MILPPTIFSDPIILFSTNPKYSFILFNALIRLLFCRKHFFNLILFRSLTIIQSQGLIFRTYCCPPSAITTFSGEKTFRRMSLSKFVQSCASSTKTYEYFSIPFAIILSSLPNDSTSQRATSNSCKTLRQ